MWLKAITLPRSPQPPYNFLCQFKRFHTLTKIVVISEDLHTQRSIFLMEKTLYQKNLKNIALFFCFVFFHFSRANDDCNLSSVITPKKIYHMQDL